MKRLTERLPDFEGELDEIAFKNPKDPEGLYNLRDIVNSSGDELIYEIATRLAHYEDLEEQGRLVELPCKVGDTIYYIAFGNVYEGKCHAVTVHQSSVQVHLYDFDGDNASYAGKDVFLSRAEAEAALAAGKEAEG